MVKHKDKAPTVEREDKIIACHWSIRVYNDETEALKQSVDVTDLVAYRVLEIMCLHLERVDDITCLEIASVHHALVMRQIPELMGVGGGQSIFIERHSGETWPGPDGPGGGDRGGNRH